MNQCNGDLLYTINPYPPFYILSFFFLSFNLTHVQALGQVKLYMNIQVLSIPGYLLRELM